MCFIFSEACGFEAKKILTFQWFLLWVIFWLVVSTNLKNTRQTWSFPQVGVKIKHDRNHHLYSFAGSSIPHLVGSVLTLLLLSNHHFASKSCRYSRNMHTAGLKWLKVTRIWTSQSSEEELNKIPWKMGSNSTMFFFESDWVWVMDVAGMRLNTSPTVLTKYDPNSL